MIQRNMNIQKIILFIILLFFIYILLANLFMIENLEVSTPTNPITIDYAQISGDIESNSLIHNSPDEDYRKQYIIDKINGTFTKNEYDILVRARQHATSPTTSAPVPVQSIADNNLNFIHGLDKWQTKYFPESIIGPNGIGLAPTILTKFGTDSYGFTFPRSYVQLQFMGYSKYNFYQTPFVSLQTAIVLKEGTYTLKYNIQTRPNMSWDIDSRSIGIMSMVNKTVSPLFLFYKMDENKKRVAFLKDETKLTPEILKFTISKEDAEYPTLFTFIFIVTDPTITNNCTIGLGDIEILNCEYNAC